MRRPAAFFAHETNPKGTAMKTLSLAAITAFASLALANFASAQDPQDGKFQVTSERIHLEHSSLKFNIRILLRFSHDKIWNIITPVFPFSVRLIVILFTNLSLSEDH